MTFLQRDDKAMTYTLHRITWKPSGMTHTRETVQTQTVPYHHPLVANINTATSVWSRRPSWQRST